MKIDSSTIGMESARSYHASSVSVRRFRLTEYESAAENGIGTGMGDGTDSLPAGRTEDGKVSEAEGESSTGQKADLQTIRDMADRMSLKRVNFTARSQEARTTETIRVNTLRYILEQILEGYRKRLKDYFHIGNEDCNTGTGVPSVVSGNAGEETYAGRQNLSAMDLLFVDPAGIMNTPVGKLQYVQETYHEETETTSFSTTGTVKCADGREISFDVRFEMSRSFERYYREDLGLSVPKMTDPLVINLEDSPASVSDQTFFFDLDADGTLDEIHSLGAGSGFLALDRNENGKIDDGSELFGTGDTESFAALARCDLDGNGWIDENDEIWDKLKIWTKDADGKDVLYTLAKAGVGAICLQSVATDFTLTERSASDARAVLRRSGVFLYEDGRAGTVQHLDLRKYEREA